MCPTYSYKCNNCSNIFDTYHSITKRLKKCPSCKALSLTRLIGKGAVFNLKGSGFFRNDYPKKKK